VIAIDASALIAMMAGEDDADALADIMASERVRLCSPVALWETTAGICRSYGFTAAAARAKVRDFLSAHGIDVVTIGERDYELAAQAYADFGKGRHPAGLNMGDCFAYASAKANRAALLFKGEDFAKTDIRIAGEWPAQADPTSP
jgi:ribonuclease VapC